MSDNEYKLLQIYKKEKHIMFSVTDDMEIHSLDIGEDLYEKMLPYMAHENLCRHFRDSIVLENYETAERAKKELNKRGYNIEFLDNSIKFTPQ
jgi:hypothetical protein